ncbi:YrhK family protein [Nocardia farcinica]|uniref:YrhK family protein n=1 Tax=Nocardia farcinica TaxID=37329 RepID=UPI002006CD73|nr:YrhK family protein [Nocardia farcinica]MBF6538299.1 YrhK family protein [Nocardia farcinica]
MTDTHSEPALRLPVGRQQIVVNNRYESISIANDVLIAVFFTADSILQFFDATVVAGRCLFLIGSLYFLARPLIRLNRRVHLQRLGADRDDGYDY